MGRAREDNSCSESTHVLPSSRNKGWLCWKNTAKTGPYQGLACSKKTIWLPTGWQAAIQEWWTWTKSKPLVWHQRTGRLRYNQNPSFWLGLISAGAQAIGRIVQILGQGNPEEISSSLTSTARRWLGKNKANKVHLWDEKRSTTLRRQLLPTQEGNIRNPLQIKPNSSPKSRIVNEWDCWLITVRVPQRKAKRQKPALAEPKPESAPLMKAIIRY